MSERIPGDEAAGWDHPDEPEDDDEHVERETQGEDPTSPARGFKNFEDLEEHDAEYGET